jgi:hypothetical protein
MEEKLSVKTTVLFTKSIDNKINEICRKIERPKSNLIRWIVQEWVNRVSEKG